MTEIDFIIKLLVSIFCGIAIGFERRWTNKIAGIQTTILVIVGSCLFVMSSYFIMPTSSDAAGRIIGQIVSGIGFLGAGMIFKDGYKAHGINSAANVWAVSAIGVIIGLGQIKFGVTATIALILTNVIFKIMDDKITKIRKKYDVRIVNNYEIGILLPILEYSEEIRSSILNVIGREEDTKIYSIKTTITKKDYMTITICINTHNLDYDWITKLKKDIIILKPNFIVDWSQIS